MIKKFTTFNGPMLVLLQLSALVLTLVGAFFVDWSALSVTMSVLFFYVYGVVGMSMMLHRFWSHRSFKFKSAFVEFLFTVIAVISSRGSPIAWVHIHRTHHANADTDRDPHRPEKFKLFSFKSTYIKDLKLFLIKDLLTPRQKIIHEYYLLFIIAWVLILLSVGFEALYFAWALPVVANQIAQDTWNYFSHVDGGYRNFETDDNSKNIFWLWPFILGEAWHNNHHKNPKSVSLKKKFWEIDPVEYMIKLVS